MAYTLHTDGGSRQNPGPAAIGGLIHDENEKILLTFSKYIGIKTNNFAEYTALIEGLKLARKHNINRLKCFLDSELVVKQLKKEYKVKDATLKTLFNQAIQLSHEFEHIEFTHIKRSLNKEADKLVNKALDENT